MQALKDLSYTVQPIKGNRIRRRSSRSPTACHLHGGTTGIRCMSIFARRPAAMPSCIARVYSKRAAGLPDRQEDPPTHTASAHRPASRTPRSPRCSDTGGDGRRPTSPAATRAGAARRSSNITLMLTARGPTVTHRQGYSADHRRHHRLLSRPADPLLHLDALLGERRAGSNSDVGVAVVLRACLVSAGHRYRPC